MFIGILVATLILATIHVARMKSRTRQRMAEIFLLYLLVGYCGIPMLAVSVASLIRADLITAWLGLPASDIFQQFVSVALLAMSVLSLLSLRYRGSYLIGPAVCWSIFFFGATFIHLADAGAHGPAGHGTLLSIVASHGLISVLLTGSLLMAGVHRLDSTPITA